MLQLQKEGDHQQEKGDTMPRGKIFKVGAHRGSEEQAATVRTMMDLGLDSLLLPSNRAREREGVSGDK